MHMSTIKAEFWRSNNHFERRTVSGESKFFMNGVSITEAHYYEALRNNKWGNVVPPVAPQTAADLEYARRVHSKAVRS